MTDLPDTQKLTLRWLFDHVPVTWWISLFILLVTIITASFSVGARDSISAWIAELTLGKLSTENANLREVTTLLKEELVDLKAVSEEVSEARTRAEEQAGLSRTLVQQNQQLSAKVRKLGEENTRLTMVQDDLQAELNSSKEVRVELAMVTDKLAALGEQNSQLLSENEELSRYIDKLKRQIEKEDEKHPQAPSSQGSARGLIAVVPNIMTTEVAGFLIGMIPKVQGGVSCAELVQLVSHSMITDIALVVKRVAPYIRRPFGDACLSRLSKSMMPTHAADAIKVLISSTPKY